MDVHIVYTTRGWKQIKERSVSVNAMKFQLRRYASQVKVKQMCILFAYVIKYVFKDKVLCVKKLQVDIINGKLIETKYNIKNLFHTNLRLVYLGMYVTFLQNTSVRQARPSSRESVNEPIQGFATPPSYLHLYYMRNNQVFRHINGFENIVFYMLFKNKHIIII